jgi:two-component system cell cycle sensor histidine kinase/response regulator CckA
LATILVVDDQRPICNMLAAALEGEGYCVLTATSGSEALRIARSCPGGLDLLLSDIEMPGMDGASLALQLRDELPGLPVLFISGSCDPAAMRIGNPASYLPKPFSLSDLMRITHSMVNG